MRFYSVCSVTFKASLILGRPTLPNRHSKWIKRKVSCSSSSCWHHHLLFQIKSESCFSSNHCRWIRFIRHGRPLYFIRPITTRNTHHRPTRCHRLIPLLHHICRMEAKTKSRAGRKTTRQGFNPTNRFKRFLFFSSWPCI
jgi:hypothetical protein